MKNVLLAFCFLTLLFGLITIPRSPGTQTEAEVKALYTKTEHAIVMRDGVKLFTSIYSPKDHTRRYPIMLSRTPYSVAPYGKDDYKTALGPSPLFEKEQFIFVYQDVRGRFMSEGEFVNVRPHKGTKKDKADIEAQTHTTRLNGW